MDLYKEIGDGMKKIILPLLVLILLTGCEATYELDFSKKTFSDQTRIFDEKNKTVEAIESKTEQKKIIDTLYNFEKYNSKIANSKFFLTKTTAGYKYSHTFTLEKDLDGWPSLVGQCYQYIDAYEKNNHLILKTPAQFLCFDKYKELTKATFTFKTDYTVISHNADFNKDNTYTWNIERNDPIKPIYIELEYSEKTTEKETKKKNPISVGMLFSIIGIIGIGILIYYLIKKKKENDSF